MFSGPVGGRVLISLTTERFVKELKKSVISLL